MNMTASLDWVTFSICHETLGSEYAFIDPEKVDETLTYSIEIWLDQHLYEIFGFGRSKTSEWYA